MFRKVTQVAMVVRSVDAAARRYWEDLGIGPWRFYTLNPDNTPDMELNGKPVRHAFRAALAMVDGLTLELIEPLDGPSLYSEFLETHGEGLHHLAFKVDDFHLAKDHLKRKGYTEVQAGRSFGVARYVYFNTDTKLGCLTELGSGVEEGKVLPAPDYTYP